MQSANALQAPRRDRLRGATEAIHRRIDGLIAEGRSLAHHEGYNAYLLATLRARGQIEADLDACGAATVFPIWPSRKVEGAIRADLADLAVADLNDLRPAAAQRSMSNHAEMLGALYVLEGSALGAQILKRRVAAMGLGPTFGARHLARQTAEPSAWRTYLQCLETPSFTEDDDRACVDSAVETFLSFERAYETMV